MKPFELNVADLVHRPGARRHERLSAPLQGLVVTGSQVVATEPVTVDVVLEPVTEGVLVSGDVEATWEGECRRCLTVVRGTLDAEVRELFEERPTEGESYPLRHDRIDLEPLVREAVLLELPQAPLCEEGCQGLCPICGANLNSSSCGHGEEPRDPRWAALDALHLEE
jgi:uncharacterized protein